VRLIMRFASRRVGKNGNESIIEEINEDYHNGECIILKPLSELDEITDNLKYFVIDFTDFLILIYPGQI
jgi:RNA-binding protein YhbY